MRVAMASCLFLLTLSCAVFSAQGYYSTETVSGASCSYGCGTWGYTYYWCSTGSSWDYCCRPGNPCDYYGESYTWCNNGYSWSYCHKEERDPERKTINGEDCRSGHSCGTHGEYYNWCYTGSTAWDYCCKPELTTAGRTENITTGATSEEAPGESVYLTSQKKKVKKKEKKKKKG